MLKGTKSSKDNESSIFESFSLYKVINTNKGKPVALHQDGSVSIVMKFEGINSTSFAEEDFETMFKRVQATLDDIKNPALSLQFTMIRDNKIPDLDENVAKLPSFLKPRAQNLKILADDYKLFVNRFYFSVHCSTLRVDKKDVIKEFFARWLKKDGYKEKTAEKSFQGLKDRIQSTMDAADVLCMMLTDIGSSFTILKTIDEYYDLFQEFTRPNKFKMETEGFNKKTGLKDPSLKKKGLLKIDDKIESPRQALFSGVRASVNKNDFILDDYYHKVWTLDRAPRDWIYGSSIEVIESVPCEFIYSITWRPLAHKEAMDALKFKLAEKRLASGGNKDALIEDLAVSAEENRVYDSYSSFANGDGAGTFASVNFVMRLRLDVLDKMARKGRLTREEVIQRLDQSTMKKIFANFGYSEWINEENTSWHVFCNLIPGMSTMHSDALKYLFLSNEDIPYFLAMYENKRPGLVHNGTNHFIDTRGNMVVFDLMDPSLPAWNYSISGQTGSGKSVLMNTILDMQFADLARTGTKPVICILDVGGDRGSYQKIMKLVNGTEINLSGVVKPSIQMLELIPERSNPTPKKIKEVAKLLFDEQIALDSDYSKKLDDMEIRVRAFFAEVLSRGLNTMTTQDQLELFMDTFEFERKDEHIPLFTLTAGTCEPSSKNFNLIMGIIEVMLSTNAKQIDGFKMFDYDEISALVLETYRQTEGRFPFLSDLLKIAENMFDPQDEDSRKLASRFKTKIGNWTREGAYPMFDKSTTIDISNDVILADLKGLESNPQLQVVYTLLISQLFNDKMYFTKDRRKFIVRDEAWSIMQNERARKYFVEDLRTARKNGFATIALSQLPTDYLNPSQEDGRAIISNMQVQVFCKFGTEKIVREVAAEFGLGEDVIEEMKTLGLQQEIQSDGTFKKTHSKFMMVMGGKNIYSLLNILHPFEYQLYSSSADDNAVIDYYMKISRQFADLETTLMFIADGRHIGDKGLIDFLEKSNYAAKAQQVKGGIKKK